MPCAQPLVRQFYNAVSPRARKNRRWLELSPPCRAARFHFSLYFARAGRVDSLTREAQAAFSPDELDRVSKLLQQEVKKASEEAKRGE